MATYDGRKWVNGVCELTLSDSTWHMAWCQITRDAMDAWNAVGAAFRFCETPSSKSGLGALDRGYNAGAIAETWVYPQQPSTALQEVHIEINLHFSFNPAHPDHKGDLTYGVWDLKTVLVHELGHTLYLGDSYVPQAVMYGYLPPDQAKSVGQDDINEIKSLYP